MFAGPNGSGKSTIKSVLRPDLLGYYVNPDEIEKEMNEFAAVDLRAFRIQTTREEVISFF
jgi:predicted ABC-type ATPase